MSTTVTSKAITSMTGSTGRVSAAVRRAVAAVAGFYDRASATRPAGPSQDRVDRYLASGGFHPRSN